MFYIGFEKLDGFMAALDPQRDTYLAPQSLVKTSEHISTVTRSMVASQVKDDHLIYCKIDFSRWQEYYGKPFGETDSKRADRADRLQEQMWQFIVESLRADNPDLELYDGAPSFPENLMLIPGAIEGIHYDADLGEFVKDGGYPCATAGAAA